MDRAFPRQMGALENVFQFVREFFAQEAIDSSHLFTADFVLEEFFTNCVKYNPESDREISVALRRVDDELILSLTDHDADFHDPRAAQPPSLEAPLEDREIGGLGIHLVTRMVDKIDYDYHDRESRITVIKKI